MARPVVVYRLGSLGDTVVALPCLHRVARHFADAERVMLTNIPVSAKAAPLEAILGGSGLVHRYMAYPVGTRSIAELRTVAKQLRAIGADTLVYLTPPRGRAAAWRDIVFFRLCGFRHIIGAPTSADLQDNRMDAQGNLEQECIRLTRCLQALGPIDLDDPAAWNLHLTLAEHDAARALLAPIAALPRIAINMGGKALENDWGADRWQTLFERLAPRLASHALLIVGGPEDARRADVVTAAWTAPVVNLCGQVSPRVSAAAMSGSALFVGHDSGPLHLAASVQVPCIGLFGNKLPKKWHPYGRSHRILHEMRGMAAIEVVTVERMIEDALGLTPTGSPSHAVPT